MTKRQQKIIEQAIILFNKKGVSNVKISDITIALDISLGNLTYYYKTKRDLIASILEVMVKDRANLRSTSEQLLATGNWIDLIKSYLFFQLKYSFFYRDILDLDRLNDTAKLLYEQEVNNVIRFNRNSINLSISKKFINPEPLEGLYDHLAANTWAIHQAWFIKRAIFGADKVLIDEPIRAIMSLYYPFLTEKGLKAASKLREQESIIEA